MICGLSWSQKCQNILKLSVFVVIFLPEHIRNVSNYIASHKIFISYKKKMFRYAAVLLGPHLNMQHNQT